jgi:hypothetical protein
LRLESEAVDFESEPVGPSEHLLKGGVGGTVEEVVTFVWALSAALAAAGVEHAFEVYDTSQQLVRTLPPEPGRNADDFGAKPQER